MNNPTLEKRYQERLNNFPRRGQNRHGALLGASNIAIMAGLSPEAIHADLARVTSNDPMPAREIQAAVMKAAAEHTAGGTTYLPPAKPAIKNGRDGVNRIIAQSPISEDADLHDISPTRLNDSPEQDRITLLNALFNSGDKIFIGDRLETGIINQNIRTVAAWIDHFQKGGTAGPFIIINPFSGQSALTKSGVVSFRCDGCVSAFRHCLVEFDHLGREDQIRFWSAAKLPILALIDSGGKSIHAWLDVQKLSSITTCDEWTREIKIGLYERVLIPLGVDRACCNPSRLSRLPGFFRSETGRFQRLLWLSPVGRRVCS